MKFNIEEAKEIITNLDEVIDLHNKMKGCYFYTPPQSANSRRWYEEVNSKTYHFIFNNIKIHIYQNTECSCKNVYYKFYICGDDNYNYGNDIRAVKKIIKELELKIDVINYITEFINYYFSDNLDIKKISEYYIKKLTIKGKNISLELDEFLDEDLLIKLKENIVKKFPDLKIKKKKKAKTKNIIANYSSAA